MTYGDTLPPRRLWPSPVFQRTTSYLVEFSLYCAQVLLMSHRRSGSVHRRRTDSDASSSALSGPPSPTFSATTNASQVLLGAGPNTIITRRDLRQAVNAYEDVCSGDVFYFT